MFCADSLSLLKRKVAVIERRKPLVGRSVAPISTGHVEIDMALGGGLAQGRVHEVFASDAADGGSAAGFAAVIARHMGGGIVWLREEAAERQGGGLHALGLVEIGIDPGQLILGLMPDPLAVLRAAADVVRCPDVGVAVIELWRNPPVLDLTASRRLALAVEASGVTAILLRIAADPTPSAAQTRWGVKAAASAPLEANAPGHPAWEVELLRQRGQPAGGVWRVEWDRERAVLHGEGSLATGTGKAPLSGAVVSFPASGPANAGAIVPLRRAG